MTMCALLKDFLPYQIILIILADILLSMRLYDHLLLLCMESSNAYGVTFLFSFFFCILVVALLIVIGTLMFPGRRPTTPSPASPSSSPCTSSSTLDSPPPSYRLLMEVEKGELPSYEEATK